MISFLQSKNWVDFQESLGRKVWQIDGVLIIKHNLPFNKSYLYSPRLCPPTADFGGQARFEEFLDEVRRIAKQENAIFWKVEPSYAHSRASEGESEIFFKNFGFKKSTNIQPQKTLILDISKSEQELLNQMHYKTRYNIQLALKRGVEVKSQKSKVKSFEEFWRLIEETTKRDNFHPHPKEYYRKMLEIPGVELFVAEYRNKVIAANIVLFYEKTAPSHSTGQAIYLHGASDYEYRNLMAPHLLQWEQIKEAKKRGCEEYDFWGIDENKWPGVTRFKRGFCPRASCGGSDPSSKSLGGGREVEYPGAYDLIFQPIWYRLYKIAKKIL